MKCTFLFTYVWKHVINNSFRTQLTGNFVVLTKYIAHNNEYHRRTHTERYKICLTFNEKIGEIFSIVILKSSYSFSICIPLMNRLSQCEKERWRNRCNDGAYSKKKCIQKRKQSPSQSFVMRWMFSLYGSKTMIFFKFNFFSNIHFEVFVVLSCKSADIIGIDSVNIRYVLFAPWHCERGRRKVERKTQWAWWLHLCSYQTNPTQLTHTTDCRSVEWRFHSAACNQPIATNLIIRMCFR